ncbi:MAG: hypothetical protein U0531_15290 [Dehalococcoidia bacterium]
MEDAAARILEEEAEAAMVVLMVADEADVRTVLAHPSTMIGSDGVPAAGGKPHPRPGAGTFPRVLGRYVREEGVLDSPSGAVHPRRPACPPPSSGCATAAVRPGAFADLVVFDPARTPTPPPSMTTPPSHRHRRGGGQRPGGGARRRPHRRPGRAGRAAPRPLTGRIFSAALGRGPVPASAGDAVPKAAASIYDGRPSAAGSGASRRGPTERGGPAGSRLAGPTAPYRCCTGGRLGAAACWRAATAPASTAAPRRDKLQLKAMKGTSHQENAASASTRRPIRTTTSSDASQPSRNAVIGPGLGFGLASGGVGFCSNLDGRQVGQPVEQVDAPLHRSISLPHGIESVLHLEHFCTFLALRCQEGGGASCLVVLQVAASPRPATFSSPLRFFFFFVSTSSARAPCPSTSW